MHPKGKYFTPLFFEDTSCDGFMNRRVAYMLFLLFLVLLASRDSIAQQIVGARVGMSNYQGDLIKEDFDIAQSNVGVGGFAEWHFAPELALQISGHVFRISGNDWNYDEKSNPGRHARAIKMDNLLLDMSASLVYYPFYRHLPTRGRYTGSGLQPYIGAGVAFPVNFHRITDQNLDNGLQTYDADQFFIALPVRFGYQMFFSSKFGVGLELQTTFTLDDESLDGYGFPGSAKDLYHFFSANFVYNLGLSSEKKK